MLIRLLGGALTLAWFLGPIEFARAEQMGEADKATVDPALESYLPTIGLKGKLLVTGSNTMQQLLTGFSKEFKKWYPGITVSVETEGSSAGFEQFLQWSATAHERKADGKDGKEMGGEGAGQSVMLASSRSLEESSVKEFVAKVGYPPMEIQIALGAVAVYVHESNPLRELTLEQLDAMYGTTRKRGGTQDITQWGQLGLKDDWEQKPVRLYGRDKQSGTRSLFKLEALLEGEFKASVQEEPGTSTLILAISNDPLSIGYAGILFQQYSMVKILAIAEKAGTPFITPSAATVTQETYPMGRKLFLYASKAPNQEFPPIVKEFLIFANSRDGQEMVVMSGLYPIPLSVLSQNLALLGWRPKGK